MCDEWMARPTYLARNQSSDAFCSQANSPTAAGSPKLSNNDEVVAATYCGLLDFFPLPRVLLRVGAMLKELPKNATRRRGQIWQAIH